MSPSVWIDKIAASARLDASVSKTNGESGSQCFSVGADINALLIVLKASLQSMVQVQDVVFQVRKVRGADNSK